MARYRPMLIAFGAAALLSSCSAGMVDVRPIKSGLALGQMSAHARVGEGLSHLTLGNVGLAQEAFRKALREDPGNVDALLGLAACYDRMGRPDLARKHYELALAAKPKDPQIYAQFAQSLVQQGEASEAARVTAEIAAISVAPETPVVVPNSVAVLPPPPIPDASARKGGTREASAAVPVRTEPESVRNGPTLIRMSLAEVALVTHPSKQWEAKLVTRSAGSTTYRFEAKPTAPVILLNAARSNGLAARTRAYLSGRGFGRASIGNAPAVRAQSAILYHQNDRARAERIAAQFGFRLERQSATQRGLIILLGRDAAQDRALRSST